MSIKKIHLNKLLRVFGLPDNKLTTLLREDIRRENAKKLGKKSGGGDFHAPFWCDAKKHAAGISDLRQDTESRINANDRRKKLYPPLRDGFLNWWDNKRRWRNEPFNFQSISVKAHYRIEELDAIVKVENLLSFSIGEHDNRLIYPYLYENPMLTDHNYRLGLWLLSSALPKYNSQDMRILDVNRSKSIAVSDLPIMGNEKTEFINHFSRVINKWELLKLEY